MIYRHPSTRASFFKRPECFAKDRNRLIQELEDVLHFFQEFVTFSGGRNLCSWLPDAAPVKNRLEIITNRTGLREKKAPFLYILG